MYAEIFNFRDFVPRILQQGCSPGSVEGFAPDLITPTDNFTTRPNILDNLLIHSSLPRACWFVTAQFDYFWLKLVLRTLLILSFLYLYPFCNRHTFQSRHCCEAHRLTMHSRELHAFGNFAKSSCFSPLGGNHWTQNNNKQFTKTTFERLPKQGVLNPQYWQQIDAAKSLSS